MCGIAGYTLPAGLAPSRRRAEHGPRLARMTASLRHRGPDAQTGLLLDGVALGHSRLAILDREGGAQPMRDPATGVTLVYNGEVFNHVELREALASGHRFRTRSDTEVVLAAFLRHGITCLDRLNGQFALAIWDPRDRTLWLARDRFGILPLHYTARAGEVAFASEAKALVAGGFADAVLDPRGVKQAIALWSPVPPRTCLAGVSQLGPGMLARIRDGRLETRRWYDLDLGLPPEPLDAARAASQVGELLDDAVRLRLRADVPVAAYLSGGLDSSVLCALAQRRLGGRLDTYSVAFEEARFDESLHQRRVAHALGTHHQTILATRASVAESLPAVVRHAESVLVRSAPAPLLALSGLVRARGGKVVLTGEGADEIFLGYDLYRETQVRAFWARRPASRVRPALLRRLYPWLPLGAQGDAVLRATFGLGLAAPAAPAFSHLVRWAVSSRVFRLLAPELAEALAGEDPAASAVEALPARVHRWRPLARAQYLEMHTLLAGNLLAAQGDRMLMASSVEGRFPFLDHRLVELAARLPERLKLAGGEGKRVLRRVAAPLLPEASARPKFPYRAPAADLLAGPDAPAWAREALAPEVVRAAGIFDPEKVAKLLAKLAARRGPPSEVDAMGITAVATAQLLPGALAAAPPAADVRAVALEAA